MTYSFLRDCVLNYLNEANLHKVVMIGHSMGGKVALSLAMQWAERIEQLVVVDVAPKEYTLRWFNEFDAMAGMPLDQIHSRKDAEDFLERRGVEGWALRKFLITNLQRDNTGGFSWQVNLPVLQRSLFEIFKNPIEITDIFTGPALFIRGEVSDYVCECDVASIMRSCPAASIHSIHGAGHNVHAEKPQEFLDALVRWMDQ
jgi:esterase